MKNKIEYIIPAWLVQIIVNDDWTATNEEEEKIAKDLLAKVYFEWGSGYWVVNEEIGFGKNDVDQFAGGRYAATYVADHFFDQVAKFGIKKIILDRFPGFDWEKNTDSHRSDFYILYDADIWHWLRRIHPEPGNISVFTGTDGRQWIEVPFLLTHNKKDNA